MRKSNESVRRCTSQYETGHESTAIKEWFRHLEASFVEEKTTGSQQLHRDQHTSQPALVDETHSLGKERLDGGGWDVLYDILQLFDVRRSYAGASTGDRHDMGDVMCLEKLQENACEDETKCVKKSNVAAFYAVMQSCVNHIVVV